jgi:N-methylhydantoinase A/oxoprolinase/acetone carboxylase beta subunit
LREFAKKLVKEVAGEYRDKIVNLVISGLHSHLSNDQKSQSKRNSPRRVRQT